jgi:chromosomal replication initiation ATPase DnaA
MNPSQIALQFPHHPSYAAEDFLLSPSNQEAHDWVMRWPDWSAHALILYGPEGAGKTHLAHLWAAKSHAIFVTDAETPPTTHMVMESPAEPGVALFHTLNQVREQGLSLLLTSPLPPAQWGVTLPDLRSRLLALPAVAILPPDDLLLEAVLTKAFSDRQLRPPPEVIGYLLHRLPRSCQALHLAVAALDAYAAMHKRALTLPLTRQWLETFPV